MKLRQKQKIHTIYVATASGLRVYFLSALRNFVQRAHRHLSVGITTERASRTLLPLRVGSSRGVRSLHGR